MVKTIKRVVYARYVVQTSHVRTIDGQVYMLEPLFSGIVTLPVDKNTKLSVRRGWLKKVK